MRGRDQRTNVGLVSRSYRNEFYCPECGSLNTIVYLDGKGKCMDCGVKFLAKHSYSKNGLNIRPVAGICKSCKRVIYADQEYETTPGGSILCSRCAFFVKVLEKIGGE